jgi:hypothetical protein
LRDARPGSTLHQQPLSCPAKEAIQYAAASAFKHSRLGVLDRLVEPGDDSKRVVIAMTVWREHRFK